MKTQLNLPIEFDVRQNGDTILLQTAIHADVAAGPPPPPPDRQILAARALHKDMPAELDAPQAALRDQAFKGNL